ncbi:MAG: hypothetical protein FJX72_15130 [Armatimonadetes bacterium]|nr:hypothetical protein [Armatimonadota bacterium]
MRRGTPAPRWSVSGRVWVSLTLVLCSALMLTNARPGVPLWWQAGVVALGISAVLSFWRRGL